MDVLRTPEDRFVGLPEFPYEPHYVDVDDEDGGTLRMAWVDEGPADARPVLLVHGEPTWGYLYRKMIPGLVEAGLRVVVPDLVGMGRSDKPTEKNDYSYPRHVRWLQALVQHADVRRGVFFGQDWGSLIGLKVVTLEHDRFDAIVLANGGLPDPDHPERMAEARSESEAVARDPERFQRWQQFSAAAEELHCGQMLSRSVEQFTGTPLSAEEAAAYDAPFPDPSYQASALIFPSLIRALGEGGEARAMMSAAWRVLERWEKPLLTAYGKEDAVLGWAESAVPAPRARGRRPAAPRV